MPDPNATRTYPICPPKPLPPGPAPLPLAMTEEEYKRVQDWMDAAYPRTQGFNAVRLQCEILDALRSIDDKLGKLLERSKSVL